MSIDPLQKRIGLSLVDEGVADLTSSDDDADAGDGAGPADRLDGRQAARRLDEEKVSSIRLEARLF